MTSNWLLKTLLMPVALLYGAGVSLRDFLYRRGVLKPSVFNLPILSVGNLSVGGTGKTPHVEYLIRLLKDYLEVATLSRGYGRKSEGYQQVLPGQRADQTGDEPLLYKRKYPQVSVAVSESRALAIPRMIMEQPELQVILLDDAFQHRAVTPGLSILLTEYGAPFTRDFLLPAGRLREWRQGYRRADIIIVTKCPEKLTPEERQAMTVEINPLPHQKLFFSTYRHGNPYFFFQSEYQTQLQPDWQVLLVCGLARTNFLVEYLENKVDTVSLLGYEDHHYYGPEDMEQIKTYFDRLDSKQKLILTTEKDAVRLEAHRDFILKHKLPLFILPVQVEFLDGDGPLFNETIKEYLLNYKV